MTRHRGELNAGNNDFKDLDALKQRLSRAGEKDTLWLRIGEGASSKAEPQRKPS